MTVETEGNSRLEKAELLQKDNWSSPGDGTAPNICGLKCTELNTGVHMPSHRGTQTHSYTWMHAPSHTMHACILIPMSVHTCMHILQRTYTWTHFGIVYKHIHLPTTPAYIDTH